MVVVAVSVSTDVVGLPMMLPIVIWPDSRLRKVSAAVDIMLYDNLEILASNMVETMKVIGGIGLSAIQVGIPIRMFVMDCYPNTNARPHVVINPRIIKTVGDTILMEEGCLSVPGARDLIPRYQEIVAEAVDLQTGAEYVTIYKGLEAQCFQHELEHLNGEIFLQHLNKTLKTDGV